MKFSAGLANWLTLSVLSYLGIPLLCNIFVDVGILCLSIHKANPMRILGKSIVQVPDTGTRVLDNTRPFLCSSIVSF